MDDPKTQSALGAVGESGDAGAQGKTHADAADLAPAPPALVPLTAPKVQVPLTTQQKTLKLVAVLVEIGFSAIDAEKMAAGAVQHLEAGSAK